MRNTMNFKYVFRFTYSIKNLRCPAKRPFRISFIQFNPQSHWNRSHFNYTAFFCLYAYAVRRLCVLSTFISQFIFAFFWFCFSSSLLHICIPWRIPYNHGEFVGFVGMCWCLISNGSTVEWPSGTHISTVCCQYLSSSDTKPPGMLTRVLTILCPRPWLCLQ